MRAKMDLIDYTVELIFPEMAKEEIIRDMQQDYIQNVLAWALSAWEQKESDISIYEVFSAVMQALSSNE